VTAAVPAATPAPQPPVQPYQTPVMRAALPPADLINTNQLNLAYSIDREGPSHVSRIELWMTPDDGRTWSRVSESTDRQVEYISALLPGEGVYGFRLVLQSGVGLSKGPPVMGEVPEMRVEVDLTPPEVHLLEPLPDPKRPDTIILQWSARDSRGLAADNPITLEWSETPDGKDWKPVVPSGKLPNGNGQYAWRVPPGTPCRVYLRVTARDAAGNVGEDRSNGPVLIDPVKPEGKIRGIVPPPPRP
jgi:hypothetical protein